MHKGYLSRKRFFDTPENVQTLLKFVQSWERAHRERGPPLPNPPSAAAAEALADKEEEREKSHAFGRFRGTMHAGARDGSRSLVLDVRWIRFLAND